MVNKHNTCCIFNVAPHYNASIYLLMDSELHCDFYIGDKINTSINLMDYSKLQGFKKKLKNKFFFSNFYWQSGAIKLFFKNYRNFIMNGEPYNLTVWIILILCFLTKKKTFLWTHGWYGDESFIKKIVKKFFFNLSSHILLYGDYARNLMIKEGFKPHKLSCIYNSMNYYEQIKVRISLSKSDIYFNKFNNHFPTLLYVGRIQKVKRLDILIQAMENMKKKGIPCNLVVIGKDEEKTSLISSIEKSGLADRVWLYGPCYDEKILGELIFNADLCVSPGNVGLTAIHCFMYGTPVITHNNYANQGPEFEVIDSGKTGAFFIQNNTDSLTEVIIQWLNQHQFGREKVRDLTYKIIDEKYNPEFQIELLKKVLN